MRRRILGLAVLTALAGSSPALASRTDSAAESPATGGAQVLSTAAKSGPALDRVPSSGMSDAGARSLATAFAEYAAAQGGDLAGTYGAYVVGADAVATFAPLGAPRVPTPGSNRAAPAPRTDGARASDRGRPARGVLVELAGTYGVYYVNPAGHVRFVSYGTLDPTGSGTPTTPRHPSPAKPAPSPTPAPTKTPAPKVTPQPTPSTPVPLRPAPDTAGGGVPTTAKVLFASSFADGLSEYRHQTNPERIQVVNDPVLGSARKVLKFQVHQSDTGPTDNPRAQIETPYNFVEGEDRYFGLSLYFPSNFPAVLPSDGWIAIGSQAYGPPYGGAGGTGLRVQDAPDGNYAELRWQRNDLYGWDMPWRGPRIDRIRGRWVDIVQRIKLHRDPKVGFVEMWMNTGEGYRQQKLAGQDRLYMNTYDSSNGGGANNSRLALYYRKDIPGPLTLFHGPHRIAAAGPSAFTAVAPTSYGVAKAEP